MPDYSYPSWLVPREAPWQALVAGAQVGSQIAANRARNQALYAQIQQQQQEQDLQERQFVARNEANTLANEVVRLKITNDAQDFEQLRLWWPEFSKATGDSLKTLELPSLRDPNQMQKIVGMVTQKREAEETAGFAAFMGSEDLDLATPEGQARYWEWMGKNKSIAGKMGVNNLVRPIKTAEDLKRLETDAASRAVARQSTTEATMRKLDMLAEHYENQDEVARMKVEMQSLDKEENQFYKRERLRQIDEEADRLDAQFRLRREQFDAKQKLMTPEQRMRYQEKKKALRDESVLGKVLDTKTGKRTAEEYQRRDKAIEDEFFGVKAMPLNTSLKNPITKDEYDKLPVGAEYVAPDGSTRVKK